MFILLTAILDSQLAKFNPDILLYIWMLVWDVLVIGCVCGIVINFKE